MNEKFEIKELDQVVVRFSGDSGDGMQLAGNIFSTVSATVGNGISTFPDYPADIRAPQGSLTGVSGFQVHIGAGKVYTPGDKCDVLVAMNAAALKTQLKYSKPQATIIIDTDSFGPNDLKKAQFQTEDYLGEMGIDPDRVIQCPLTTMVKDCLADTGMDNKAVLKCRNMFALGLVCWLFDRDLSLVANFLREKFAKIPAIAENNIKVVQAGYDYGHNTHSSAMNVYRIETKEKEPVEYRHHALHLVALSALGHQTPVESLRRYDEVEALVDYHHAVAHRCRIGWRGLYHSWSVVVAGLAQLLLADGVQQCHARYCRRWLLYAGSRPARASLFCWHPLHLLSHSHHLLVRIAGGLGWCLAGVDSQHQLFVESGILFHGRSLHRPVALSQLGIAQTR